MKYVYALFALLFLLPLQAQQDSSFLLPTVEIQASRIERFGTGTIVENISTEVLNTHNQLRIGDLLNAHSNMFIRSYGPGSLTTASSRGSGYGRTALLWNGFSLDSPMNGGSDFSLIPVLFFDQLTVQYGGGSSLSGSGAIGGSIQLNNPAKFVDDGLTGKISLSAGSFQDYRQAGRLQLGRKSWSASLSAFHQSADNDFSYNNKGQKQQLPHNALQQYGSMASLHWRLNDRQQISTHLWYQNSDRELPPTLTTGQSEEEQADESLRLATEWRYAHQNLIYKTRLAYLYDKLLYQNPLLESSLSKTHTYDLQTEAILFLKKRQTLNIGLQGIFQQAQSPNGFTDDPERQRLALFAAYKRSFPKSWALSVSLRQELSDQNWSPTTGAIGLDKKLNAKWKLAAQLSRNYRLPTFNDLYWAGAGGRGNPDLKAESAWNQELSLEYDRSISNMVFLHRLTIFSHYVDNWILWAPVTSDSWEPNNLQAVWSRGLAYSGQLRFNYLNWTLESQLRYSLSKASHQQVPNGDPANILGKQLIQNPIHTAHARLALAYKRTRFVYFHQFSSKQYTSPDNLEFIAGYQIGKISLHHRFRLRRKPLVLTAHIDNLWNKDYQIVPFRPMPLRHYRLEALFSF